MSPSSLTERGAGDASTAHTWGPALKDAVRKLAPQHMVRNPVMAVVWLGTVLTAVATVAGWTAPLFGSAVTAILLATVLFANFAEAVADARGRGQAASLRRARADLMAHLRDASGKITTVSAAALRPGDLVEVAEG